MAVYNNTNANSSLTAVEFTPMSDGGNFMFFHVSGVDKKEEIKQWLTTPNIGQKIVAETMLDGKPVLVTHGDKTQDEMIKSLEERGDKLQLKVHKKPLNYWAVRGGLSVVGQTLHLASAILGVEKVGKSHARLDPNNAHFNPKLKEGMYVRKSFQKDIGVFATLNQIANVANMVYGGQKEEGDNRLHAVKGEINKALGSELMIDDTPIAISEDRSKLREGPQAPLSTWQKFDAFAKRYSVRFFEIGLRVVGTTALIVPWKKAPLTKALAALKKGHVIESWNAAKNTDKFYLRAGQAYLAGKFTSFLAKVPDPYEDKPHTWVDTVREKVLFKAGTFMEFIAAGFMSYNAFTQKKMGFHDAKTPDIKPHADVSSGIGGALFATAFIARFFAPFGNKSVDMEEVYAHAADTLAKTPPEKLPQLMADTSATLKEHFKDKPEIEFGMIFTKMMTDMYRYHHVALKNLGTEPEERAAKMNGQAAAAQPQENAVPAKHVVAHAAHSPLERVRKPGATHAIDAAKPEESYARAQV